MRWSQLSRSSRLLGTSNSSPRVRATGYCFRHGEVGVSRVLGDTLAGRPQR